MSPGAPAVALLVSPEDLAEMIRRELAPLRAEIEALRSRAEGVVTIPEAATRLGVTTRAVQRWLKDGRLELVQAGGVRMVRWPPRAPPR